MDFFLPNTYIPKAAEIWKTVRRTQHACVVLVRFGSVRRGAARDRKSTATVSHRQAISSQIAAEKQRFGCGDNARIRKKKAAKNARQSPQIIVGLWTVADELI